MKNIQVIDGAENSTFSIFQATDDEFALMFPEPGQDIQWAEDLVALPDWTRIQAALALCWERPIRKQDAIGIHGTLFYQLQRYKQWYPEKREDAVDPSAINPAQRRLFARPRKPPAAPHGQHGHRVEIDAAKRIVEFYRVHPDGREVFLTSIPVPEGLTGAETAAYKVYRNVGQVLMFDSPAGRALLGL